MKVVHVISSLKVGGAESMLRKLIETSSARDHLVVSLSTVGEMGAILRAQGIEVRALGMGSPLSILRTAARLAALLRQEQPDVVQTWMYHADFLGGLVAKALGIRVVWSVRTTELPQSGSSVTRWIRSCCARLSTKIPARIVYAANASRRLHEGLGYASTKSLVIPNGFQMDRLRHGWASREAIRLEFGLRRGDIAIGCVGRFHDDKDPLNFLRAGARLIQQGHELRLLMVGRELVDGNPTLAGWIQDLGLQGRVLMLGERSDVPACLGAMDVFCLPSKTEGFPNVLGEAMGVGIPCVATDVGDVRVVLGDCGIVVPPEDSEALAAGLEQVLRWSAEERAARVDAGRQRIADHYSIEATCRKFEQVYDGKEDQGESACAV
ncbi:glycosyltransferase family 4 protein [Roseateles sp. DXS20W]|uniref:glycosyltransferase family 4 protein n=1 Tax=Pelomonas lactea TaxID=3299030 RepID=UPI003747A125